GKMPLSPALLEYRPFFRSRDVDETRAFFATFGLRFDPIGSASTLEVRLNGEPFPGFYIGYVQFGAAALVGVDPKTDYVMELPWQGRFEAVSRHDAVGCDGRQGVVLSPTPEHVMRSETGAT